MYMCISAAQCNGEIKKRARKKVSASASRCLGACERACACVFECVLVRQYVGVWVSMGCVNVV